MAIMQPLRRLLQTWSCPFIAAALGALACASLPAQAQSPQPVRLVVPYAAGGGGDALARILAPKLGDSLGQQVIVENKPGASGIIATDAVIKAAPDGRTILLHTLPIVMTPAMFATPPYDVVRDLTAVTELIYTPIWLAVSTSRTQAKSVKEFIDQVRAEPKKHYYASISPGSTGHLYGFHFNELNNLTMEHVAYKGGAPATTALLAGDISAAFLDISTLKPHLAGGRIRLLAVTGLARSPQAPDIPTFVELGYKGFEPTSWAGLFVPKGTPAAQVKTLSDTVNLLLKQPDIAGKYKELGYEISNKTQPQFAAQVQSDRDMWSDLVRKAGVKMD